MIKVVISEKKSLSLCVKHNKAAKAYMLHIDEVNDEKKGKSFRYFVSETSRKNNKYLEILAAKLSKSGELIKTLENRNELNKLVDILN